MISIDAQFAIFDCRFSIGGVAFGHGFYLNSRPQGAPSIENRKSKIKNRVAVFSSIRERLRMFNIGGTAVIYEIRYGCTMSERSPS